VTRGACNHAALLARLLAGTIAVTGAGVTQCVFTASAWAQAPSVQDAAATIRAEKDRLQQVSRDAQSKVSTLQADAAQMAEEQTRLNAQLQETAKLVQRSEAQMSSIESRRDTLEVEQKALEATLSQRQESIGRLLSAMQRMGRNPPPVIITRREDALQMVRSAMLLAKAFPELRTQYEDLAKRLSALARVMGDIKTERDKLESETGRLKDAQLRLASLMETKRQTLSQRQDQLDGVRKAAAEISKSVEDLAELITKLDKTVADRTTLGSYDRELAKVDLDKILVPPPASITRPAIEQVPTPKLPDVAKVQAPDTKAETKVASLPPLKPTQPLFLL
jgi:murein hydrolase activator